MIAQIALLFIATITAVGVMYLNSMCGLDYDVPNWLLFICQLPNNVKEDEVVDEVSNNLLFSWLQQIISETNNATHPRWSGK